MWPVGSRWRPLLGGLCGTSAPSPLRPAPLRPCTAASSWSRWADAPAPVPTAWTSSQARATCCTEPALRLQGPAGPLATPAPGDVTTAPPLALPTPAGPGGRRWLPSLLLPFLLRSRETQSWCPEWQPRGSSGTEGTLGSDAGSGVSRWGPSPLSPVSAGGFYPFPRGPKSGPGGPSARRGGEVGGQPFPSFLSGVTVLTARVTGAAAGQL